MPSQVSFPKLVEALANAVISAQHRLSQHQINNVRHFFDDKNRPVSVDIRTPSLHPDSEPDEDGNHPDEIHRIPLITLVQNNQLVIKEFDVSFDATLGNLTRSEQDVKGKRNRGDKRSGRGADDDSGASGDESDRSWMAGGLADEMSVDPEPSARGGKGPTARISMHVEAADPPEGMARLIDRLVKTI